MPTTGTTGTISTADNHGNTATTENHEGDIFSSSNKMTLAAQKSGYSSQATSTSSLWQSLPLEWLPAPLLRESNCGSSHAELASSNAALLWNNTRATLFKCKLSAWLHAEKKKLDKTDLNTPCYKKSILGSKWTISGINFFCRFLLRLSENNHSRVIFMAKFVWARSDFGQVILTQI